MLIHACMDNQRFALTPGRTYLYNVSRGLDLGSYGGGLDCVGVKLYCAPVAKRVADRAMQVDRRMY